MKPLFADFWFGFVMRVTAILPEILHTLQLRGWLVGFVLNRRPRNLQIAKGTKISNIRNISFGDDVFISGGCWILANCPITLEDEVMFGPMCVVVSGNHTIKNGSYRFGPPDRAPISIGFGSWIGAHSVITKGVVLGQSVLVAAGSSVGKSFPDGAIVGGVPARLIRTIDANSPK